MVEERQQFPKRWPHLTTLYNASPFMSTTRSYKEVDEWNSLRPLPTPLGGYPPSYEDTYSRDAFASYKPQRHFSGDKFARGYANSNYDAFSMSTYHNAPDFRKDKVSKSTHFLACAIGISLILALIGAIAAVVIVLSNGSNCDSYSDSVWVMESNYDHSQLMTDSEMNYNFTRDFCYELETAFRTYFMENHMCGCKTVELSVDGPDAYVAFNIDYRRINENDKNETFVGRRLAIILNKIISENKTPSFVMSYNWPQDGVTKAPMSSIGNETLMGNGTDFDDVINGTLDTDSGSSNSSSKMTIEGGTGSKANLSSAAEDGPVTTKPTTPSPTTTTVQSTAIADVQTNNESEPTTQSTARSAATSPATTPVPETSAATTRTTTTSTTTTATTTKRLVAALLPRTTLNQAGPVVIQAPPESSLTVRPRGSTSPPSPSTVPSIPQAAPVTDPIPVLPTTNDIATTVNSGTSGTTLDEKAPGDLPVPLENPQTTASNYAIKETTLSDRNPAQAAPEGSQLQPTT